MNAIIYTGVRIIPKNYEQLINDLKNIAQQKKWTIDAIISETVFDPYDTSEDKEYYQERDPIFLYILENGPRTVMVSDVDHIGKNVADILPFVKMLHEWEAPLYVMQFDMTSLENSMENTTFMLLLQMMATGVEIEEKARKELQRKGIEQARLQGKYSGRKKGAITNNKKLLKKYRDIIPLLKEGDLSLRQIAAQTNHSVNTVQKIRRIISKK
jgi:DNA invertase Pin-like site-specific DNA recombinase